MPFHSNCFLAQVTHTLLPLYGNEHTGDAGAGLKVVMLPRSTRLPLTYHTGEQLTGQKSDW